MRAQAGFSATPAAESFEQISACTVIPVFEAACCSLVTLLDAQRADGFASLGSSTASQQKPPLENRELFGCRLMLPAFNTKLTMLLPSATAPQISLQVTNIPINHFTIYLANGQLGHQPPLVLTCKWRIFPLAITGTPTACLTALIWSQLASPALGPFYSFVRPCTASRLAPASYRFRAYYTVRSMSVNIRIFTVTGIYSFCDRQEVGLHLHTRISLLGSPSRYSMLYLFISSSIA